MLGKNYEYTLCKYDHSAAEGPNCDAGKFTARSWSRDDTDACVSTDVQTDCGGLHKNCYGGPGTISDYSLDGVPAEIVIPSLENGFDNRESGWSFPAPLAENQSSNLFLANYLKMCVDETHTYTYKTNSLGGFGTNSLYYFINAGYNITSIDLNGTDRVVDPLRTINPYYAFVCYDRAKDIKARVRVIVREWDRRFSQTDPNLQQGNPDTGKLDPLMDTAGAETSGSDFGPWNDFNDWGDKYLAPVGGGCGYNNIQNYSFPNNTL